MSAKSLVSGEASGRVVFSNVPLSFMMGVDSKTGIVVDAHHPLLGTPLKDTIVVIPGGRGSCSGSAALLELMLEDLAPAALVFQRMEEILTLGVLVARAMFDKSIPVLLVPDEAVFQKFENATKMEITKNEVSVIGPSGPWHLPIEDRSLHKLDLNDSDRAILRGEKNSAAQIAMDLIVSFAEMQGATSLIDVSQVHIDACAYNGKSSLLVPERLLTLGGSFVVKTTCNSLNVDLIRWRELGSEPEVSKIGVKIAEAYLAMGAGMSFTCAPYLLNSKPEAGEQVGWSESNAVVFANSVLGARTQKYPDYMDVFIALTGRAPCAGCHLPEGRRPGLIVQVPHLEDPDESVFPLLGYLIGDIAGSSIPLILGLEVSNPCIADLKAFGAGFATTSSAPMFHIKGVTPEAGDFQDVESTLKKHMIHMEDLQSTWKRLNTAMDNSVDVVTLGNPHFSLEEFQQLSILCKNRTRAENTEMMITTSREIYQQALNLGYLNIPEDFGARFITDTCWCMIDEPVVPTKAKNLMTNSAKYAHYGPGMVKKLFHFGGMESCINAACTGKRTPLETSPSWLFGWQPVRS